MSDFEFSDASDADLSDLEVEREEEISDFEDEEVRVGEARIPCLQRSYNAAPAAWLSSTSLFDGLFPRYNDPEEVLTNPKLEEQLFSSFMSPGVVAMIVQHTNSELRDLKRRLKERQYKEALFRSTNEFEIKGLMRLWISLGMSGFHKVPVKAIFSTQPGISSQHAQQTFSRDRYQMLLRALRFDDKTTRPKDDSGRNLDKLRPIREVFERVMENCREQHTPGEFMTVDETLADFRGRCSFRMYIPTKAAKFGIKIWSCVDAKSKYLHTSHVYPGKDDISSGTEVVTHLTKNLWEVGRTIVCDNYFTSPELGKILWQQKTHLLGTVRPNRKGLPKDFVNEQLEVGKAKYVFRGQETLMKLQVQQRKSVLLYSTFHHDAAYDPQAKKPPASPTTIRPNVECINSTK